MKSERLLISCLLAVIVLSGCAGGNKFASSFGKRKYTKGYFWNIPADAGTVETKNTGNISNDVVIEPVKKAQAEPIVQKPQIVSNESPKANKPKHVVAKDHIVRSFIAKSVKMVVAEPKPTETATITDDIAKTQQDDANYTDYGIVALIFTIIWIFLTVFLSVFKISLSQPLGVAFLVLLIAAMVIGYIYSLLAVGNEFDIHHKIAVGLFYLYSLITLAISVSLFLLL